MTEADWFAATDPVPMLDAIAQIADPTVFRKAMLFGCGCCRETWDILPAGARQGVETIQGFLDGKVNRTRLERAERGITDSLPRDGHASTEDYVRYYAVGAVWILADKDNFPPNPLNTFSLEQTVERVLNALIGRAGQKLGSQARRKAEVRHRHRLAEILRDVCGNPFQAVKIPKKWLTEEVIDTARRVHESCAFEELPALAEALARAGADHQPLLEHCRSRGPHVPGCWAVDLVLGYAFPVARFLKKVAMRAAEEAAAATPGEPGAIQVCVDEAYGLAFVYDEANRPALEQTALAEFGAEIFHQKAAKELERTGLIRVLAFDPYEREDPFFAELIVGSPPAEERVTKTSAKRPQRGLLHLPTGRLRIETTTSLSVGPEEPEREGVTVPLPAGEYDVALYVRKSDKVHLLVLTPRLP